MPVKRAAAEVSQIVLEHEHMCWTADQIIQAHPHLRLAQVHDALSYYYDYLDEINTELRESKEIVEAIRHCHPRSILILGTQKATGPDREQVKEPLEWHEFIS